MRFGVHPSIIVLIFMVSKINIHRQLSTQIIQNLVFHRSGVMLWNERACGARGGDNT